MKTHFEAAAPNSTCGAKFPLTVYFPDASVSDVHEQSLGDLSKAVSSDADPPVVGSSIDTRFCGKHSCLYSTKSL